MLLVSDKNLIWTHVDVNNMILLRDDFRIGLVISQRVFVWASCESEGEYIYTMTNN